LKLREKINNYKPSTLFSKIFFSNLVIVIITLIIVGFLFFNLIEKYLFSFHEWELTQQAKKVADVLQDDFKEKKYKELQKTVDTLVHSMDVKVRVFDTRLDSSDSQIIHAIPKNEEEEIKIGLQPYEIESVMQGNVLSKKLYGPNIQRLLVAMPVTKENKSNELPEKDDVPEKEDIIGVITVSAPITNIETTMSRISRVAFYSGILSAIIASIMAFVISRTISRPVRLLIGAAKKMAAGNYKNIRNFPAGGELKELVMAFNRATEEVKKTIDEQKRLQVLRQNLVANVSHEFRSPLTSIQGFAESILMGYINEEKEKEKCLKTILKNSMHLKRLVDDLLQLSHIESGYFNLKLKWINAVTVAKNALSSTEPEANEKNIKTTLKTNSDILPMYADKDRVFQVLTNLLRNAIYYTDTGGKIVLSAIKMRNKIIFRVRDNGVGISSEHIPYLWDQFYKAESIKNKSHRGKGLGLSIVKKIVELHGGKVKVKSIYGKGSIFGVIFPNVTSEK